MDFSLPDIIFPWNVLYSLIDECVCQTFSEDINETSQTETVSPKKTISKNILLKNMLETKSYSPNVLDNMNNETKNKNQIEDEAVPSKDEVLLKQAVKLEEKNSVVCKKIQKQNKFENTRKNLNKNIGIKIGKVKILKRSLTKNEKSYQKMVKKNPKKDSNSQEVFSTSNCGKNIQSIQLQKSPGNPHKLPQTQLKCLPVNDAYQMYASQFPFRIEMNNYGNAVRVSSHQINKTKYSAHCFDVFHRPVVSKVKVPAKPTFVYQNSSSFSKRINKFNRMPASFPFNNLPTILDKK